MQSGACIWGLQSKSILSGLGQPSPWALKDKNVSLTPHLGNYFPQSSSLPIWDTDKAQKLGLGVKKKKKKKVRERKGGGRR